MVCHYTRVREKIIYLSQNCKLSGNLLELELCMLLGLSQFPCVFLFPVSSFLQDPTLCGPGQFPWVSLFHISLTLQGPPCLQVQPAIKRSLLLKLCYSRIIITAHITASNNIIHTKYTVLLAYVPSLYLSSITIFSR